MPQKAAAAKKKRRRTPFLKSKILFWVLFVLCFPLALFILWRYKPYEFAGRSIITVFASFLLFSIPFGYHYYQEYLIRQEQKAAQQAVIDSDPLYGYADEELTTDQASFLKYNDQMEARIDDYNGLNTNIEELIALVQRNRDVNMGVMLAHLDNYEKRLNTAIETVTGMDLSTFSDAEKAYFDAQKQNYVTTMQKIAAAYELLQEGIRESDVDSMESAKTMLMEKNKDVTQFAMQLKKDAKRLNVSTATRKPLGEKATAFADHMLSTPDASENFDRIRPAASALPRRAAPVQPPQVAITPEASRQTITFDVDGTTVEGDIISIY